MGSVLPMTTIAFQYCPITVDDVDAAIVFYRDALGLETRGDVASDGFRWVTLGFPSQPGLEIVLSEPGAGRSADDGEALHRLLAKGSLGPYVFSTDDLDATFERLTASGAEVLQEPMDQPWGPRDCAFRDPAGNIIRINQAA
jgi:predicted enzyme related to lactoylglutathione lyase